jgi:hypothetical protein
MREAERLHVPGLTIPQAFRVTAYGEPVTSLGTADGAGEAESTRWVPIDGT